MTRARTATATAIATKPRSDLWRGERHENKARETAYVTRALSDYFGAACKDRGYSVTWKPIRFAPGATDTQGKRVILSSGLLAGLSAPFTGEKVDELTGIAAHEAGHALIAEAFGHPSEWQYDPLSALCRNLIEDMAIDAKPMQRYNGELGALTSGVRRAMRDEQAAMIAGYWRNAPGPASAIELARIWGCARLFDSRDAIAARAGRELDTATIAALDPIADSIMGARMKLTDKRFRLVLNCATRQMIEVLTGHEANAQAKRQADADQRPADADKAQADSDRADTQRNRERNDQAESGESERGESGDDQGIDDPDIDGTAADSESDTDSDERDSADSGKRERRDTGDTSDSEPDADAEADADANTDTENGDTGDEPGDADAPGDSESGDSDADSDTDGSESGDGSGSGGTGAGAAGEDDPEWTGQLPTICINAEAESDDQADGSGNADDPTFWRDVQREAAMLEAKRPAALGSRDALRTLAPYIDRKIIGQIERAYSALATEPTRRTRTDSGKIDRRRLVYADGRSDVFAQHVDRALEGSLILLLDLSGTTVNQERLIKQAGASIYAALKSTPIRVWVYSYGDPNVVQLATPDRVVNFDTVKANGGTPTAQAFARARADVKPRGQSVIIHVTDGEPDNAVTAHAQMEAARVAGWKVINVLIGRYSRRSLDLAKVSDSVVSLRDYRELPAMLADAVGQIVRAHKRTIS